MSDNKTANSESLKKTVGADPRADRAQADNERVENEGTAFTMEERRKMLRSEWTQEVLPTPPLIPGWHFCWLSTTNASDPIYKRMQKGYEPVRSNEIPAFAQYKVTQGEYEGCIACNEMLLFKIPEEVYQDVMSYFHYELPLEEEEMLKANLPEEVKDSSGRKLNEVEGFDRLVRRVRQPTF